jgi:hypothetical protein
MEASNEIRVLKTGTCPSLSGKSKLGYEIGCGATSDLHVRVSKNTGTGFFSKDWVAWDDLGAVLGKGNGKLITSNSLGPLFKGRSINTAGFLLAVLKHEGLVQPMEDKPRCYERLDGAAFMSEISALMGSPGKVAKVKKAAVKKPKV